MKDCVSCVHEYLSPMSDTCRECGIAMLNYKEAKPKRITNADRIRAMTDEELADYFSELSCWPHASKEVCRGMANCMDCWLGWLKEEVKE